MPAHGRAGARATLLFPAALFAKRDTKSGGGTPEAVPLSRDATGQEARAGLKFSVWIFAKKSSDFVQRSEPDIKRRLNLNVFLYLAPAAGFEPATKGLTVPCATAALRRNKF